MALTRNRMRKDALSRGGPVAPEAHRGFAAEEPRGSQKRSGQAPREGAGRARPAAGTRR